MNFNEEREAPLGNLKVSELIKLISRSFDLNFKSKSIYLIKEIALLRYSYFAQFFKYHLILFFIKH